MRKIDKDGNLLIVQDSGFYLKLANEIMPRKIFTFNSGKIMKYVKNSNVMQKPRPMIGFNYYALQMIQDHPQFRDKNIYIQYKKKYYKIDSFKVLNHKEFLYFKKEGFELQCFYPIKLLEGQEYHKTEEYLK